MANPIIQYKLASLKVSQGRYYVYFRSFNPKTQKLETRRIYVPKYPTKTESIKHGKALVAETNKRLLNGWNPFTEHRIGSTSNLQYQSLDEAVDKVYQIITTGSAKNTVNTWNSYVKSFKNWYKQADLQSLKIYQFDYTLAQAFMDHLLTMKKSNQKPISPISYNNRLVFQKILFKNMVSRGYLKENPFEALTKIKVVENTIRKPFTTDQLTRYANYVKKVDHNFYVLSGLCYYMAIRPIEILRLQKEDFNLKDGILLMPGNKSKNKKTFAVVIPEPFINDLTQYLEKVKPTQYLFGNGYLLQPSYKKTYITTIANKFNKYKEELNLPSNVTFYSLKDTAADMLVKSGMDLKEIRDHYRHSNIAITDKYIKKITPGTFTNTNLIVNYPSMSTES